MPRFNNKILQRIARLETLMPYASLGVPLSALGFLWLNYYQIDQHHHFKQLEEQLQFMKKEFRTSESKLVRAAKDYEGSTNGASDN
jgi:hypothetical protein